MKHILPLLYTTAFGWSGDGHRIISDLALRLVDARARSYLSAHIPEHSSFSDASVWADTDEAKSAYPGSEAFHFSSTPYRNCQPFNIARDCGHSGNRGVCIVTGLSDSIQVATDVSLSIEERSDALKFVLHLMADIHQPLHTGFREDYGGNRIRLKSPAGVNLHEVWDTLILDHYRAQLLVASRVSSAPVPWRDVAEFLATDRHLETFYHDLVSYDNITDIENPLDFVSNVATDTVMGSTCRVGYTNEIGNYVGVGDNLSVDYFAAKSEVAIVQILKAASRLANIINLMSRLYTERTTAVRRAEHERRRGIFQHAPEEVVSLNRFAALSDVFLDANTIAEGALIEGYVAEVPPTPTVSVTRTTTPGKKKKKNSSKSMVTAEEEDFDTILAQESALHNPFASFVFYGTDISRVVLIRRNARNIITYKSLAKKGYLPKSSSRVLQNGVVYYFDIIPFPSMNRELVTRTLLKINGIDPRIDISDILDFESMGGAGGGGSAGAGDAGIAATPSPPVYVSPQHKAHAERQEKLLAEIAEGKQYTLASRILRMRDGYAYFEGARFSAFYSLDTLRSARPGDRMRLNVLFGYEGEQARVNERMASVLSGGQTLHAIFYDPAIHDLGPRNRAELDALIAALRGKSKDKRSDHDAALRLRPHMMKELASLTQLITISIETMMEWMDVTDEHIGDAVCYSHSTAGEILMKVVEWVAHY